MKLIDKFFKDANKKQAISWAFFDFANSSYAILILSFVFPIYFKEVIAGEAKGDFYWGLIVSLSVLLGGLMAPIVGAVADYDSKKKSKFVFFTLITVMGTVLLYFAGSNKLLYASLIFIAANLALEIAQTLYDSFLTHVSTKETIGRISGLAWGFGYLGGVTAMLLFQPFYGNGYAENESLYKLTFPLTGLFFFIFSMPAFLFIKEHGAKSKEKLSHSVKMGFLRIKETLKNLRKYKQIGWFLLGFYFMNDALVTLFAFVPIYGRTTLNMEFKEIAILLLFIQILAFPCATFLGLLSDKKGSKKILLTTIALWGLIVILLAVATSKTMFYLIGLLTAFVIGSSQAIARSWLSKLVPDEKRFEFFGFNAFASKVAATTGPILFGTISLISGSQRLAIIALLPFFILAFLIFRKVKEIAK